MGRPLFHFLPEETTGVARLYQAVLLLPASFPIRRLSGSCTQESSAAVAESPVFQASGAVRQALRHACRRLTRGLTTAQEPPANIRAHPSPSSILEWHYVLQGTGEYEGERPNLQLRPSPSR